MVNWFRQTKGGFMKFSADALEQQKLLQSEGYYKAKLDGLWGQLSCRAMDAYCIATYKTHIKVIRAFSTNTSTAGRLFLNGLYQCDTLEDPYHPVKVYGDTRIPEGFYHIDIRATGGFHNRYSRRYPEFHEGMLQLRNVPGYTYILIHIGNSAKDTRGCILVGRRSNKGNYIYSSAVAYKRLYTKVITEARRGDLFISLQDFDR